MNKSLGYCFALLLTTVMVADNAAPAFAGSSDSGPGVQYQEQTQNNTADTGANAQSGANTASQDTDSQNTGTQTAAGRDGGARNAGVATDVAEEAATAATEAAAQTNNPTNVPERLSHLQTTVLLQNGQWSRAFVNNKQIYNKGTAFISISVFLTEIIDNVHYRAYTSAGGWIPWAMNGRQTIITTLEDSQWAPIETVQVRPSEPVHSDYSVYYTITLSNGKEADWAMDSRTAGTMNQGLALTGLRVSCFARGDTFPYRTANPVVPAHTNGTQNIDGALRYTHGDGSNFMRWGWDDMNRYYFIDSNPVTGWQYLGGYKYYFAEDGKLVQDLEPIIGAKGPYQVKINKEMSYTTVYIRDDGDGFITPLKTFLVPTGDDIPLSTFSTPEKYRWRLMNNDVCAQYATRLDKGLLFLMHSIIYDKPDTHTAWASTYNHIGVARSAECIRLLNRDAKWIYDNCPVGTTVVVYNDYTPGPYERPVIAVEILFAQGWSPTDVSTTPEGIAAATAAIMARVQ